VVHRTVRWANGRQRNGRSRNPRATRGPHQRSTGGTGLSGVHRTVSGAPSCPKLQRSTAPYLEGNRAPDSYSDCPVHHTTEGKISLLRLSSTAPSCLGAIKGTPMRMEEWLKHSLSILRLQDSNFTHSILCDSDLSSIWVVNSVRLCFELKSWLVCVVVLRIWVLCVLLFPTLLLCVLCDQYCKGERLQLVEIPHKREKTIRKKSRGIQVDHWITWKGLGATLVHWDATMWK
jgi:hypothetical protein